MTRSNRDTDPAAHTLAAIIVSSDVEAYERRGPSSSSVRRPPRPSLS